MTPDQVRELMDWLVKKSQTLDYGEIVLRVVCHDGDVKFIERQVCEKVKMGVPDGREKENRNR